MDTAFELAGQKEGLEIWRVEDFKPVAYPKSQYGKFHTGDSYIVLNTLINKSGDKSWDIHFWLGNETSQDEAGAAAILSVELDDYLGGEPIQHREKQEHESELFLSYFKSGVRYQPGGVQSGFHHVDPDAAVTRLFQVKGSRNIRVKEVDPSISSMNKGDCFILDVGKTVYVYVGEKSKRIEKIKTIQAANQIRDQDHAGRSEIVIVDEFSPQSDFHQFFEALGGGSREAVAEATAGGDDGQFEKSEEAAATLYRISDSSGTLSVEPIAKRPLEQSMLDEGDLFILDTGNDVFVWVGRKSSAAEKKEAMKKGEEYLKHNKRPDWTHMERVCQGAETAAFTQYFRSWQNMDDVPGKRARGAHQPRLFHARLRPWINDFKVEEVIGFEQDDLNTDDVMFLYVPEKSTVYLWIGRAAEDEERNRSLELIQNYFKQNGREDTNIVTLEQGEETEDFKSEFPAWDPKMWGNQADVREHVKSYKG